MANRISLIHSCAKISQWNHVRSKSKPADIASRGLMPDKLASADLWFHGPEFLWKHNSHWPKFPTCAVKSYNASKITCEIKANYINCEMVPVPEPKSALSNLLTRFSTFERLQRSVAWILRFKNYVKWKFTKNEPPSTGCLSVSELNTATLEICKLMQRESLSPELNYYGERIDPGPSGLHSNGRPPKTRCSKSILQLSPFVKDGILRVGGRLQHSHLPYDQKFPIILSPQHPVTELIVDYYHRRDAHSGTLQVLSAVREKFWIVHGQSSVRKILRKCVLCKMKNAKTSRQWMAPLPGSRVQTGRTPFDHTMIDYLGPFKVKLGRKEFKRWIFLPHV